MGRRSRARRAAHGPAAAPSAPPPAPRPARLTDERPKAPWHPVPLVELSVLVGIVLIVLGFVSGLDGDRGRLALLCGLALASLGGLDTALREHFAGFRSHSTLLAGLPAIVAAVVLGIADVLPVIVLIAAVAVFAIGFVAFRTAFRKRAGVGFKV